MASVLGDQAKEAKTRGNTIEALLDPSQKEAFAQLRAQELENRIETKTYAEMQHLQQAVPHLTAEQKDQAFAALSEEVRRRESSDDQAPSNTRTLEGTLQE